MRIELNDTEYREGFQDAADGKPARVGASWSYLSGWIEGEAERLKWNSLPGVDPGEAH